MKIEKANIKAVEWILEFLADDLDNISDLDFSKCVLDAQYYFVDQWAVQWLSPPESASSRSDQVRRKTYKKELPTEKTFGVIGPSRYPDNYPWRETLKEVQANLRTIAKELSEDQPGRQGIIKEVGKVSLVFDRGPEGMFIRFNPISSILDFHQIPKREELVQLAERTFYISANGLPPNAIRPCKECGKYFLHLSEKVKYFCSPRCASRNLSRERREKDPEGYRAKQREIMRRKYQERRAKESGHPVEKIVFQKKSISKKGK